MGLSVAESELPFVPTMGTRLNTANSSRLAVCSSVFARFRLLRCNRSDAKQSIVVAPLTICKHRRLKRSKVTVVTHSTSNLPQAALTAVDLSPIWGFYSWFFASCKAAIFETIATERATGLSKRGEDGGNDNEDNESLRWLVDRPVDGLRKRVRVRCGCGAGYQAHQAWNVPLVAGSGEVHGAEHLKGAVPRHTHTGGGRVLRHACAGGCQRPLHEGTGFSRLGRREGDPQA